MKDEGAGGRSEWQEGEKVGQRRGGRWKGRK